jgi:hypothetical protein
MNVKNAYADRILPKGGTRRMEAAVYNVLGEVLPQLPLEQLLFAASFACQ